MPVAEIPNFVRGTDYTEYPQAKLWIENGKLRGERVFRIFDYTRYAQFLTSLAGGIVFNGAETTRVPPVRYRDEIKGVYCTTANHKGIGVATRLGNGDETFSGGAEVTVGYETLTYDPSGGSNGDPNNPTPAPYVTESRSTGGTVLTLKKANPDGSAAWKWLSDDVKLDDNAPDVIKVQCEGTYTLTRHFVEKYPKTTINGLIGKTNSSNFPSTSSAGGYGPQELLFLGDDSNREFFADGSTNGWTVALKFAYNPNGWNTLYRQDKGEYQAIVNTTSGFGPVILSTDFPNLLTATS